jgi:hypothetical protein
MAMDFIEQSGINLETPRPRHFEQTEEKVWTIK